MEVVHRRNKVALLSMREYDYKTRQQALGYGMEYGSITVNIEKVKEFLYLATPDGKVTAYASRIKDTDRTYESTFMGTTRGHRPEEAERYSRSKTERDEGQSYKVLNRKLLFRLFGPHEGKVRKFVESNALKLNTIKGLKRTLDYFDAI